MKIYYNYNEFIKRSDREDVILILKLEEEITEYSFLLLDVFKEYSKYDSYDTVVILSKYCYFDKIIYNVNRKEWFI